VTAYIMCCVGERKCECNDCFMLDPGSGKCFNCSDYFYNVVNDSCATDFRQDQRRAFVLSFFLSSTGAANFYIESYGLGKFCFLRWHKFIMNSFLQL
jgi:hypothetical protein